MVTVKDALQAPGHDRNERPGSVADTERPPEWGQVQVEMTSRCNLRCATCLYPAYEDRWRPEDLSSGVFSKLLKIAHRCDSVHLQGWGETLMRGDTAQRIADLRRVGTRPTLGSNGSTMTPEAARELIDSGLASMTFSLAGPDQASHDGLRGRGTFAATVAAIQTFVAQRGKDRKPPVLINYLLTPYSFPRLPQALALASRMGVDTLVATHLVHVCTPAQKKLIAYEAGRRLGWVLFRSRLAVLWRRTTLVLPGIQGRPLPVCSKNPLRNLFVAADGSVSPCVYLCPPLQGPYTQLVEGAEETRRRLVFGHLEEDDLDTIWDRPAYGRFRRAFQRRQDLYQELLPPARTDFEGLDRLEKATRIIRKRFATPDYQPPEPCRGCPHLLGY